MHHVFIRQEQLSEGGKVLRLTGDDFHHVTHVLRMKEGEELSAALLADGTEDAAPSVEYRFGIEEIGGDHVLCRLRFVKEENRELPAKITLLQCLPKGDKMESIVQKAVELGAHDILPVAAKRCVVKLDETKAQAKVRRWQKIAEAAAMQSKRGVIPEVMQVRTVADAIASVTEYDLKLIPYELAAYEGTGSLRGEDAEQTAGMRETRMLMQRAGEAKRIAVFIGPEGGFEEKEVEQAKDAGFHAITLGRRILRTETAGPAVLAWLMFLLES